MKLALLNIGSELLRGRTVNTNAATIGQMLLHAGYAVETTLVIHDDGPVIEAAITDLLARHDAVLVTGGLGPTKDDITKQVLLRYFGGEMVCHAPTLRRIEDFLARLKRPLLEHNRQQAFVPSSCTVIENEMGTAPGMAFGRDGKTLVAMPGVPQEMRHLMQHGVIAWLQAHHPVAQQFSRIVRTFGIPESRIAEKMEAIEPLLDPRVQVAYLPSYDGTKIELKAEGAPAQAAEIEAAVAKAQQMVAELLAAHVYALEDKGPDQLLAEWLMRTGTTFGTAESCTGGAISAKLVQHSGISVVHKGGVVAYMASVKEAVLGVSSATIREKGIVSEEVAREMAEGARRVLGCDHAVAITGIAEAAADAPESGQPQAWMALAGPGGTVARHFRLLRERRQNIEVAANAALVFALKELEGSGK